MSKKQACILGAGHSAHVAAGLIASNPGWEVRVHAPYGDEAERWQAGLERGGIRVEYGADDGHRVVHGRPTRVSAQAEDVVPGAELVVMCVPGLAFDACMRAAAPYVDHGAMIGAICGTNGVDWCVDDAMAAVGRGPDSYGVFSMQNLPWACRASDFGVTVQVLGAKPWMEIAARPASRLRTISDTMSELIRVPCPPVPSGFLGIGLSNLCQVIHPAVMYDNFGDWDGETPFEEVPLFYQGLSQRGADDMQAISDEIVGLEAKLEARYPGLDLSVVHPIMGWCLRAYGQYIEDSSTLRSRFATNRAFHGLEVPMVPAPGGGWLPDFRTRYLAEDIPYNLVAVRGVALLAGFPTPTIDRILLWAQRVMGREYLVDGQLTGADIPRSFAPQRFGFERLDDIPELAALRAP